jgi:hypothetical protein
MAGDEQRLRSPAGAGALPRSDDARPLAEILKSQRPSILITKYDEQ